MKLRSMLFVPADSERKLAKSVASEADALILTWKTPEARKAGGARHGGRLIGAQVATMKARSSCA